MPRDHFYLETATPYVRYVRYEFLVFLGEVRIRIKDKEGLVVDNSTRTIEDARKWWRTLKNAGYKQVKS